MSPPHRFGLRSSFGNEVIAVRCFGFRSAIPKRPSNSVEPNPTVTVSPSAGTSGPSVPLSDGGSTGPGSAGMPPWVRKRARAVSVFSRSISSPRPAAVTLNETKQAAGGGGLTIPACHGPWNGIAGSRAAGSEATAYWKATVGLERVARARPALGGVDVGQLAAPSAPAATAAAPVRVRNWRRSNITPQPRRTARHARLVGFSQRRARARAVEVDSRSRTRAAVPRRMPDSVSCRRPGVQPRSQRVPRRSRSWRLRFSSCRAARRVRAAPRARRTRPPAPWRRPAPRCPPPLRPGTRCSATPSEPWTGSRPGRSRRCGASGLIMSATRLLGAAAFGGRIYLVPAEHLLATSLAPPRCLSPVAAA